ncbi:MAG: response regulator [Candidatus Omnitrophota bacterium]
MIIKNKLSILVVDDSATIRETIVGQLLALGYVAQGVPSAEEAEKLLSEADFDILFLDIKLSGIDGMTYLETIRQSKANIAVIIMTAFESPKTAVEAIEKGACDYLIKPIQGKHLELIILRALRRRQLERERKDAIEKRINALLSYTKDTRDMKLAINALKLEVNNLLIELGQQPKYTVIEEV